ncbi:MAG: hypothetical protein R2932_02365 [Caldilineaceae bacterium]
MTPEQIDTVIGPPLQGIVETIGAATLWLTQSHLDGVDDGHLVEGWLQARHPSSPNSIRRGSNSEAALRCKVNLSSCRRWLPTQSRLRQRLFPAWHWPPVR